MRFILLTTLTAFLASSAVAGPSFEWKWTPGAEVKNPTQGQGSGRPEKPWDTYPGVHAKRDAAGQKPPVHLNMGPFGHEGLWFEHDPVSKTEAQPEVHAPRDAANHGPPGQVKEIPYGYAGGPPPGHVNEAPYGHPDTYFHGPEEAKNNTLHSRTSYAGVYWCPEEDNWGSPCYYTIASGGRCHAWNSPNSVDGSFGPDHGIRCSIWSGHNCQSTGGGDGGVLHGVQWPGFDYLSLVIPWVNDLAASENWVPNSFKCGWI